MQEIWKDVIDYELYYQISNHGRIRSKDRRYSDILNRSYFRKGIILKQQLNIDGYPIVGLQVNKSFSSKRVHVLVAKAFVPNPLNLSEVNHKDLCKTNNFDWNLEWTTHQNNVIHCIVNNGRNSAKGTKIGISKLNVDDINEIFKLHSQGIYLRDIANKLGVAMSTVQSITTKKTWKHLIIGPNGLLIEPY